MRELRDLAFVSRRLRAEREAAANRAPMSELAGILGVSGDRVEELAADVRRREPRLVAPVLPPRPLLPWRLAAAFAGVLATASVVGTLVSALRTSPRAPSPAAVAPDATDRFSEGKVRVVDGDLPPGPALRLSVSDGKRDLVAVAPDASGQPLPTEEQARPQVAARLTALRKRAVALGFDQAVLSPMSERSPDGAINADPSARRPFTAEAEAAYLVGLAKKDRTGGVRWTITDPPTYTVDFLRFPVVRPTESDPMPDLVPAIREALKDQKGPLTLAVRTGARTFKRDLSPGDLSMLRRGGTPRAVEELGTLARRRLDELARGARL